LDLPSDQYKPQEKEKWQQHNPDHHNLSVNTTNSKESISTLFSLGFALVQALPPFASTSEVPHIGANCRQTSG
jgi:hypothetical protein